MATSATSRRHGRPTIAEATTIRESFLNQAFVMLCERGVHGFSVDALAKASGVTKRTIYRHYKSKSLLIEAVVEREARRLIDDDDLPREGTAPPLDRLRQWSWRLFRYLARDDAQRLALLLRFASLTEVWAAEMLSAQGGHLLDSARVLIVAAQDRGDLRAGNPDLLVALLLDLIDGVFHGNRGEIERGRFYAADFTEHFESRWRAFLQLARPDWSGPATGPVPPPAACPA